MESWPAWLSQLHVVGSSANKVQMEEGFTIPDSDWFATTNNIGHSLRNEMFLSMALKTNQINK